MSPWKALIKRSKVDHSAVGEQASVNHAEGGSTINHFYGESAVPLRPRDAPRHKLPSTRDKCIGRAAVLPQVLDGGRIVEVSGPYGIGRTTITQHVAELAKEDWDAVYYTDRGDAVGDIVRGVLACFFEWDEQGIPSSNTVEEALRIRRALVVLDNAALGRDEVQQVANVLGPEGRVVFSSLEPQVVGGADFVLLPGLDPDDAVELAAMRLKRPLDVAERAELRRFAVAVDGHPFKFLRAILRLGARQLTFDALAASAQADPKLTDADRQILEILRCFDGAAIPIEELEAFCESRAIDVAAAIERLESEGMIQRHSPRISLREAPDPTSVDVTVLRDVLSHFATVKDRAADRQARGLAAAIRRLLSWLGGRRRTEARERVADTAEAILGSLRTGMAARAWDDVHRAASAVTPVFGQSALPGAWDVATDVAVRAADRLERPAEHAAALQERGCYLAVVEGPEAAAPLFEEALWAAEKSDTPELATLIARNLEQVALDHEPETVAPVPPKAHVDEIAVRRRPGWFATLLDDPAKVVAVVWAIVTLASIRGWRKRLLTVAFAAGAAGVLFSRHRPSRPEPEESVAAATEAAVDDRVDA